MNAVNLFSLTRIRDDRDLSMLLQALSGNSYYKHVSPHEAASLWSLADELAAYFAASGAGSPDIPWPVYMDGFYFSYTIEHIGKEFDLLKIAEDLSCILNIELKSEAVEEERIRKQLIQNRYYLSHISRTILSFTYVMETNTFYHLNERGYLKKSSAAELAVALLRPSLRVYKRDHPESCFRTEDYLISPVASPEKFLQGQYFLTNQQAEFRRQILELLHKTAEECGGSEAEPSAAPVISISGIAGTGKTLLLYDLAMALSEKRRVLLLYAGPEGNGHRIIDGRLKKVDLCSAEDGALPRGLGEYACLLVDEANRLSPAFLGQLLKDAADLRIPVIASYDPRSILTGHRPFEESESMILNARSAEFEFSGHIRINRPVYSFLRTLFHRTETGGHPDYSCIDVLYAGDEAEASVLEACYRELGYCVIHTAPGLPGSGESPEDEYGNVMVVIGDGFYYDSSMYLRTADADERPLSLLYEALARTKGRLCLLIIRSRALFSEILSIRLNRHEKRERGPCEAGQLPSVTD